MILCRQIAFDRHQQFFHVVDGTLMTDACWSEDEEIERGIDAFPAIDSINIGLSHCQQVEGRQDGFVLFNSCVLASKCALNCDRQLAFVQILAEGQIKRKPQNLSFLTAVRNWCIGCCGSNFFTINILIINNLTITCSPSLLLISTFLTAVRFLRI